MQSCIATMISLLCCIFISSTTILRKIVSNYVLRPKKKRIFQVFSSRDTKKVTTSRIKKIIRSSEMRITSWDSIVCTLIIRRTVCTTVPIARAQKSRSSVNIKIIGLRRENTDSPLASNLQQILHCSFVDTVLVVVLYLYKYKYVPVEKKLFEVSLLFCCIRSILFGCSVSSHLLQSGQRI